jgi:hypothetical protein
MNRNIFTLIIALFISAAAFPQLSGTYYIPSGTPSYATIQAAVSDLNTLGINGNVTFNVAPGYTETAPAGGIVLGSALLNPESVTYTITFQRDGAGTSPLITAFTGTTTNLDGIWKIAGTDNVTIDGIDLAESGSNADQTTRMEFGYALFKLSNTAPIDGCQNVTIKNCTIALNKFLTVSTFTTCTGIYSANTPWNSNVAIATLTATTDAMNNCKFYSNTITNVTNGIWLTGWTNAPVPFDLFDVGNQIGVQGANTITNFNTYGIRATNHKSLTIANNSLTSVTLPASSIYGIYTQNVAGSDTYGNTVTIQPTGGNLQMTGLSINVGLDAPFNGNIYNNTVQNCTNAAATSAAFVGITNSGVPGTLNFYSNTVTNNSIQGTGAFTGMDSGGAGNVNMHDNTVSNNTKTGTANSTNSFVCIRAAGTATCNAYNNLIFSNNNSTAASFSVGNTIGIHCNSNATVLANVYKNKVYDLTATGGGTSTAVYGINASGPVTINVYNNFISDLKTPNATSTTNANAIAGINIGSSSINVNVFYNTVYLNATSTGTNFWTTALFANTTPTVDLRDNVLINVSTPNGTGIASAYRRSSVVAGNPTYSMNSNANVYYAGTTEDATHAVYVESTTPYNFVAFQVQVGPARDAGSFSELPPFVNVGGTPYDLHMQTTVATVCESGGVMITSPLSITTDFDGNIRSGAPDIGADEFTGLFAGILNPGGVATTVISSSQINVVFVPNPSNNNVVIVWNTTGAFTTPAGAPPTNPGDPFAGGSLLYNGLTSPANHTGLTGATTYYYKAFSYDGSAYSNGVVVSGKTDIGAPTNFTATAVSSSQINLAWTKNAFNNDVMVATNSTTTFGTPVNGTSYPVSSTIPGGGTVIYVGPASGFNHTSLSSYTLFNYKAWSVDQGNNYVYSPTGVTASATTLCSAATVPWNEGFEYGGPVGCGTIVDANNDYNLWLVYNSSVNAHSGLYLLRILANPNNDWYFSNGLQLTAGVTYEVKFWYRTSNTVGQTHQLEVKWGSTPSAAGMNSTPLYYNTSMTASTTYNQVTCSSFTPSVSGTYYVGWHDFSAITPGHNFYIDDLSVAQANFPASSTWTGTLNSDWYINNNWNPAGVPGATSTANIPGGLTNYPSINAPTTISSLTIASGASLLDNSNLTVSGATTVQRDYAGGEWHLISSPITNATANMFLGLYLQQHTESTNLYTDIINPATPLNVMQGYALYNAAAGTATFTGPLNTGPVGSANNVTRLSQGWNLVGNPYCSYVDWDAASGWTKTNVDNATYRHVNSATWASYVGGVGANGGTRYIAPCQGFFVGVTDGQTVGTLNMNNNVRTNTSSTFFKDEVADIVRLEVTGNGYTDETVVRFLDEASPAFDGNWDAHKLFGSVSEAPAIYSPDNGMMAINSLPPVTAVPIGVNAGVNGEFTISATETSEFADVILEDLKSGTFTNLKQNAYTFNYEVNNNDRFILHFSPMGVPENTSDLIGIYSIRKDVYVSVPEKTTGDIEIYNLLGQKVAFTRITGTLNKISLAQGNYYLVKVMSNDGIVTKKVFVN